jgi:excisionase family DNA binding protein
MEQDLTFEQLPQAVTMLTKEISELKLLLLNNGNEQQSTALPEQLLNIQQAAAFLNLTVPTIYTKVSKSELPVMKRGKRLYFSQTELLEYLKTGRKKSNAEIEAEAASYLKRKVA